MTTPNYKTFYDPPILPTAYIQAHRQTRRASAPVLQTTPLLHSIPTSCDCGGGDRYTHMPPPPRRKRAPTLCAVPELLVTPPPTPEPQPVRSWVPGWMRSCMGW